MTGHNSKVLSNIHPYNLTGPQTELTVSRTNHRLPPRCQYWHFKLLKSTGVRTDTTVLNPQSWFRTSDYTRLPSQKPSNQNNIFLKEYHANKTEADTVCHTKPVTHAGSHWAPQWGWCRPVWYNTVRQPGAVIIIAASQKEGSGLTLWALVYNILCINRIQQGWSSSKFIGPKNCVWN